MTRRGAFLMILITGSAAPAMAQDSLSLVSVHEAALAGDPRARQLRLLTAQSELRLRNIDAELRPSLSLHGDAQYQSQVARIPISVPGISIPTPAYDTYEVRIEAQQKLYDPTLGGRRRVERAREAESTAQLRATIYPITEAVNTAYFSALRSQEQIAELQTTITDIEAQLKLATARVSAGTALRSEANVLQAELLRRRQMVSEQLANRRAAIAILADLTRTRIDSSAPLRVPDLATQTGQAVSALASIRNRPEFERFARTRDLLQESEVARSAEDKPRIVAFGRSGYGRPGLNPLSDSYSSYWLAGIRLQWNPFNWGITDRDREVSHLQQQIVTTEEEAFAASLKRSVEQDIASIDRIEAALVDDDRIIELRADILAETRARYSEGVVTAAEYVDRQTDLLAARVSRSIHRVELSQARAHFLTTLGIEVR